MVIGLSRDLVATASPFPAQQDGGCEGAQHGGAGFGDGCGDRDVIDAAGAAGCNAATVHSDSIDLGETEPDRGLMVDGRNR